MATGALIIGATTITKTEAVDACIGDSICRGTGHALGIKTIAIQGAGSCRIARFGALRRTWDHLVISAGINDDGACVAAIFAKAKAKHLTAILPAPINGGRAAVIKALRPQDTSVSYACAGGCTKVNFHPGSYPAVAKAVRDVWNTR